MRFTLKLKEPKHLKADEAKKVDGARQGIQIGFQAEPSEKISVSLFQIDRRRLDWRPSVTLRPLVAEHRVLLPLP